MYDGIRGLRVGENLTQTSISQWMVIIPAVFALRSTLVALCLSAPIAANAVPPQRDSPPSDDTPSTGHSAVVYRNAVHTFDSQPRRALAARAQGATVASQSDILAPYSNDIPALKDALEGIQRGRHKTAQRLLKGLLEQHESRDIQRAARWLLIRSLEASPGGEGTALWRETLEALQSDPIVAGAVHYRLGEHHRSQQQMRRAVAHYKAVPPTDNQFGLAMLRAANVLVDQGRPKEALAVIARANPLAQRRYLRRKLVLAEAAALQKTGKKQTAIGRLYSLWSEAPSAASGRQAERALRALKAQPRAPEYLTQAFVYFDKGTQKALKKKLRRYLRRYRRAGRYARSLARGVIASLAESTRKAAVFHLKRAQKSRRPYVAGHALLRLATVYNDLGREKEAAQTLDTLIRRYPHHPSHVDALTQALALARRAGKTSKVKALTKKLDATHPGHPKLLATRWESAWSDWRHSKFRAATKKFEAIANEFGQLVHLGQATWFERATYWNAEALLALGDQRTAITLWRTIVENYPLSYYSHQSYNRLVEYRPELAQKLRPRSFVSTSPPPKPVHEVQAATLELDESDADIRLSAFLIRCGLLQDAFDDLEQRRRTSRLSAAAMSLYLRLSTHLGQRLEGRLVSLFRKAAPLYPSIHNQHFWRAAYPLKFWSIIGPTAKRFGLSPWLVIALIRHESNYRPTAQSRARAIGLMQLLQSTAKTMAKRLVPEVGRVTRKTLRTPEVNIPLGSAFLSGLQRVFQANPALMLAAYNAGPGRTRTWVNKAQESEQHRTDVLIEEIPYRETQGYVKSVLASYGVYKYLYAEDDGLRSRSVQYDMELPKTLRAFYE